MVFKALCLFKGHTVDGKSVHLLLGNEVVEERVIMPKLDGNDTVFIVPTLYSTYLSYSDISMTQVDDGPS